MTITFHDENLRDCLIRVLIFLLNHNSLTPSLKFIEIKVKINFDGSCLKQNKITFINGEILNTYIIYNFWERGYNDYPALEKCLFAAFK